MGRWLLMAVLAALISGCGSLMPVIPGDPDRLVIGVSAARPAADNQEPSAEVAHALDWKVSQICTDGYARLNQTFEPAEQDQQLVDWQLRCNPYHLSVFGLFPAPAILDF
jgi:hypothetical protein